MIRLLIVDDHDVVREGLKQILELNSDIKVIGMVNNGFECLDYLEHNEKPDIIFMDIKMPGLSGVQTTRIITQKYTGIHVIILTVYDDQQYITDAIQAGAKGYVLKSSQKSALITAVNKVFQGYGFLDETLTPNVLGSIISSTQNAKNVMKSQLSKREFEILNYIVEGMNDNQIANRIFRSSHTVRTHVKSIYKKLSVTSRSQAVSKALKNGLIEKK